MRAAFLLCLALLTSQAGAAFDVFLQVTPVTGPVLAGGSVDPIYSGWIEASSFEAGAENPATIGSATGGAGAGKVKFKEFTIVKTVDAATPLFFEKLSLGQSLATIKMVVVSRSPTRVEVWDIKATTCYFTSQSFSAVNGLEPQERIAFAMGAFEWSYIQLSPAGDPLSEYFANWSVLTNTGTTTRGVRTPDYLGGLDSDGDGIPDGWEAFYGLKKNVADSGLDTDGDGLDNLHEYIAHTDPRAPQSLLRVTAFNSIGAGNYMLRWQSVAGLSYRIFTAPAPGGPFTFLKTVGSAGNGTTSTNAAGPAGQFFYRVVTP